MYTVKKYNNYVFWVCLPFIYAPAACLLPWTSQQLRSWRLWLGQRWWLGFLGDMCWGVGFTQPNLWIFDFENTRMTALWFFWSDLEPGMMYFPTKWGAKEPKNLQNHWVDDQTSSLLKGSMFNVQAHMYTAYRLPYIDLLDLRFFFIHNRWTGDQIFILSRWWFQFIYFHPCLGKWQW